MFMTLLLVTFGVALAASFVVVLIFRSSLQRIFDHIIGDEISHAWVRYIQFAVYVVGISGGVRIHQLERYVTPASRDVERGLREVEPGLREVVPRELGPIALDTNRWVLEIYRTLIGTLQSVAWMLLIVFIFALLAYVVVRVMEMRRPGGTAG